MSTPRPGSSVETTGGSTLSQSGAPLITDPVDFCLVLGGPLYQMWRSAHLSGDALEHLRRRIIVVTTVAWVPLLLLSVVEGQAWGGVALPFLYDIELHVRLLVALPLLLLAELVVYRRVRPMAQQFLERNLIPDPELPRFHAAVASATRLRNSVWAEVAILAFVYIVGVGLVYRTQIALDLATWSRAQVNGLWRPSLAGWWLALVSLPLFQFLLLRWYFRLFIWARFLWQVSRIQLRLMSAHPDHVGGMSFVGSVGYAFSPLLLAQGAVLAGMIADRIFYAGAKLPEFKVELIGLVTVMVFVLLGPLLVFCRQLEAAKRAGVRQHGVLAQRYVREYEHKWLHGGAPADEPLLGSADIQSMADLANSFANVKEMRWVPFTMTTVFQLAVTTLLPVLPLTLTMIPLEELLDRLLKIVF